MGESFIWSLTMTDIFSGWTDVNRTKNQTHHEVIKSRLNFSCYGVFFR